MNILIIGSGKERLQNEEKLMGRQAANDGLPVRRFRCMRSSRLRNLNRYVQTEPTDLIVDVTNAVPTTFVERLPCHYVNLQELLDQEGNIDRWKWEIAKAHAARRRWQRMCAKIASNENWLNEQRAREVFRFLRHEIPLVCQDEAA